MKPQLEPSLSLVLSLCLVSSAWGCKKTDPGAAALQAVASGRSPPARSRASDTKETATLMLTKEEVGAILGEPVTEVEGSGTSLTYKTKELFIETTIDLEQTDDAVESMALQHKALDGPGDPAPGVGDEAFFGILSTLYVRKGNKIYIRIVPPNLQSLAQSKAVAKINAATAGRMKAMGESIAQGKDVQPPPDDLEQASKELREAAKGDPIQSANGNSVQGALGYIKATKHTGTAYETKGRAMAVALANKLLAKL